MFSRSKAGGCGSISTVISSIILLCVSSIIIRRRRRRKVIMIIIIMWINLWKSCRECKPFVKQM